MLAHTTASLVAIGFALFLFIVVLLVRDRDDKDWAIPILIYNNIVFLTLGLTIGIAIRYAYTSPTGIFNATKPWYYDPDKPTAYVTYGTGFLCGLSAMTSWFSQTATAHVHTCYTACVWMAVQGRGPHNHLRHDVRNIQTKWNIGYFVVGFGIPLIWVLVTTPIMYISTSPNGCSRSWLPTVNAQIGYIIYGIWMVGTFILRFTFCTHSVFKLAQLRAKIKHVQVSTTTGATLLLRFVLIDIAVLTSSLNTVANIIFNAVTNYQFHYYLNTFGPKDPNTVYYAALLTDSAYTKLITGAIFLPLAALFVFMTLATGAGPMAKYSAIARKAVTIKNMARLLVDTEPVPDKNSKGTDLSVNATETRKVLSSAAMDKV
ncbi:hypothetical protein SeMB42_g01468 [Synchytrium endobioticum]|uniref:Uncharacterized protein n=1 Tax=Synchytrium endobioticum TaxID=286115 RepID=A0A507DL13_9FUNG|nr:hypothetical protein SeMB42_g01468 [Synchytrium endobioticum]